MSACKVHWKQDTFLSAGKAKDCESHPFVHVSLFDRGLGFFLFNLPVSSQGKSKEREGGLGKGGEKLFSNVVAQNSNLAPKIVHCP